MEDPGEMHFCEGFSQCLHVLGGEVGEIDSMYVRNIFNENGGWGELVVNKITQVWPLTWLDICDCTIEVWNNSSLAETLGFEAVIRGGFTNINTHPTFRRGGFIRMMIMVLEVAWLGEIFSH